MWAASCGNTIFVSWVGSYHNGTDGSEHDRYGHISTFNFTEADGFKKVDDVWFKMCDVNMGEITVSKNCSIIGVICETNYKNTSNGFEFQPINETLPNLLKNMYLFEWTNGKITSEPERAVLLSDRGGGWNFGHLSLKLNNDATRYDFNLKSSIFGNDSVWHEHRADGYVLRLENYDIYEPLGRMRICGSHAIHFRLTHNEFHDLTTQVCSGDDRILNWRNRNSTENEVLATFKANNTWYPEGGVGNTISVSEKGWMTSALGPEGLVMDVNNPDPDLENQQIGIRLLPPTVHYYQTNDNSTYQWHWITPRNATKSSIRRAGLVQLMNWGMGGENSGRFLLGYSPSMIFQGLTDEYHAVEINEMGEFLHEPYVLQHGGWGEDSLGVHVPGSGCVVFPFAWFDSPAPHNELGVGPGGAYPSTTEHGQLRSQYLRLTALCPTNSSQTSAPTPSPITPAPSPAARPIERPAARVPQTAPTLPNTTVPVPDAAVDSAASITKGSSWFWIVAAATLVGYVLPVV
jgi:hypothetical protein